MTIDWRQSSSDQDFQPHVVFYAPEHAYAFDQVGAPAYYRTNKFAVASFEQAYKTKLVVKLIGIDWDFPKGSGLTWDSPSMQGFDAALEQFYANGLLPRPTIAYRTKGGYHWVYTLSTPVDLQDSEALIGGMIDLFRGQGWAVDDLHDWTRLFKLPLVNGIAPDFDVRLVQDMSISYDPATLPRRALGTTAFPNPRDPAAQSVQLDDAQISLIQRSRDMYTRRPAPSDVRLDPNDPWRKKALRKLRSRHADLARKIGENQPIALPGDRYQALLKDCGSLVSALFYVEGSTPHLIYGMLLPVLDATDKSPSAPGKPDATNIYDVAYELIARFWLRDLETRERKRVVKQRAREVLRESMERTLDRSMDDNDIDPFIVVVHGQRAYCYDLELGGYGSGSVPIGNIDLLIGSLMRGPLGNAINFHPNGVEISSQEFKRRYCSNVANVEYVLGRDAIDSRLDLTTNTLYIPMYALREDVPAERSPDVEQYLYTLANNDNQTYIRLCATIAGILAVDRGPSCSLAVVGAKGIGKGMLSAALAACFTNRCSVDWGAIQDQFGSGLELTPMVVVDEGLSDGGSVKNVGNYFRSTTTSPVIEVNRKFRDPVKAPGYKRWLFTANDMNWLEVLVQQGGAGDGSEAMSQRLFILKANPIAAQLLGRDRTKNWIDDGQGSPGKLLRHFFWLYSHIDQYQAIFSDGRMTIAGAIGDVMRDMLHSDEAVDTVVDIIGELFAGANRHTDGSSIWSIDDDGNVLISFNAIKEVYKRRPRNYLSVPRLATALKRVSRARQVSTVGTGRRRYWILDMDAVLSVAIGSDILHLSAVERVASALGTDVDSAA